MMEAERNRRDQTRLLELIEQNTAHHRNVVVSIQDFILLKPPVFRCSSEPLEADDWLRSIERKLDTAHVAPDDRVVFAVYFLECAALEWWENYVAMQPDGHVVTWQEFCVAFRGYHILDELMERKKEEFCNLNQGEMSIHEYVREFNRLARLPKMRLPPMPESRKGSARDLAPSFVMTSTSSNLPPLRISSTDPSELSMAMKFSKSLASMLLSLPLLPVHALKRV